MADARYILLDICRRAEIEQWQLARLLCVGPSTLNNWMGGRKQPGDDRLRDIKAIASLTAREINQRLADLDRPHTVRQHIVYRNGKMYCTVKRCIWRTQEGVCPGAGCLMSNLQRGARNNDR